MPGTFGNTAERRLGLLRAELAYARVEDVVREGLHEFVDGLQLKLNLVDDAVQASLFADRVPDPSAVPSTRPEA